MLVFSFLFFLFSLLTDRLGRDGNKSSVEAATLCMKEQNVILASLFSLTSLICLKGECLTGFALAIPQNCLRSTEKP